MRAKSLICLIIANHVTLTPSTSPIGRGVKTNPLQVVKISYDLRERDLCA